MKYSLLLATLLSTSLLMAADSMPLDDLELYQTMPEMENEPVNSAASNMDKGDRCSEGLLYKDSCVRVSVVGQGVSPMNTSSPAQAYALAKRAAIADSYRLIAEKVKGVRVDGQDIIKNMMIKKSTVRTSVNAMVKNANIVETTFKDGLCEVEMEILVYYSQFSQ